MKRASAEPSASVAYEPYAPVVWLPGTARISFAGGIAAKIFP